MSDRDPRWKGSTVCLSRVEVKKTYGARKKTMAIEGKKLMCGENSSGMLLKYLGIEWEQCIAKMLHK